MAILRRHGMPDWALTIVREVCGRVGVRVSDVASRTKHRKVVLARNEAMYLIKARKPDVSMPMMGRWFNRDHTAVLYGIASHQDLAALPRLVGYDLDRVRQRNAEFVMRYTLRRALDSAARELKERREKQE
ncbi:MULTISPECIES: helix-turn-helix domain-containing protein [Mesorhizobium]|uniref:helix-turn-helix domain-containing protein n=1 Tax=Mesorhizobium australicum TaxID=536018 RepID=UPI00333B7E7A